MAWNESKWDLKKMQPAVHPPRASCNGTVGPVSLLRLLMHFAVTHKHYRQHMTVFILHWAYFCSLSTQI